MVRKIILVNSFCQRRILAVLHDEVDLLGVLVDETALPLYYGLVVEEFQDLIGLFHNSDELLVAL